jgi:hypothetical protein
VQQVARSSARSPKTRALCRLLRFTYNQSAIFHAARDDRRAAGSLQSTRQERAVSRSLSFLLAGFVCASLVGCSDAPGPVEKVAKNTAAESAAPESAPSQYEPPMDDGKIVDDKDDRDVGELGPAKDDGGLPETADDTGPHELVLDQSGISFIVPAGWNRVKPPNRIVEAEFELPRVEGDEYSGRLTLMSSGGDPQEILAIRTAEFRQQPGEPATTEKMMIGDHKARLIDLRGEWKESVRPSAPRADYRMLLFIMPFSERSAFYAKLTGPRSTVAAHEAEFREFLRTAKITR